MTEQPEKRTVGKPATPPKIQLAKYVHVDAACVSGYGSDPAPNLVIVSVRDTDGRPITGLGVENFTLVNYNPTNGHANLVELRLVRELIQELPSANVDGVYNVEPEKEPYLFSSPALGQDVGQTVYAIKVNKTEPSPSGSTIYSGQTVVAVVVQKRP